MTDWTSGYVAAIDYTHGYYTELNPGRIKLAFAANGLAYPDVGSACELGFGQGISTNIHAAASTVSWWGTDFNPSQAGFAQTLGAVSGARLFDDSFADFCQRTDLPDFDFIALHGIWSWINDENRQLIVEFVRRKLKVGGVLYISYNTLPGWSTAAPLQHLISQHKEQMGVSGIGLVNQIEGALTFTERLLETNPMWLRANPQIAERFKTIKPQNRQYLAHEYFNQNWHLAYFADMVRDLGPAKLNFASSAHYNDFLDEINLTAEHQALLKEIADSDFRQTARDYMVNQQFRKDYWVKGARRLSAVERAELLREQLVVMTTQRSDVPLKAKGVLGEADMGEALYQPLLDLLGDHQPRTLGQIEEALQSKGITFPQILQATLLLIGQGHVSPAQDEKTIAATKAKAQSLNLVLMRKARGSNEINALASPVTGGGLTISRFNQLFILSQTEGHTTPEQLAGFVWKILEQQNERILNEGKALQTAEENLRELTALATTFNDKVMPIVKALQII